MNFLKTKWIFLLAFFILILWGLTLYFVPFLTNLFFPDSSRSSPTFGEIGDMFGAVNAIFSGFAFAGIIVTILYQKTELAMQRDELKATREEFQYNRITNLVYKQIERIDEKISQFAVNEIQGAIGQGAIVKVNLDVNAYDKSNKEDLIFNQLAYLENKIAALTSILQTVVQSGKIIEEVITQGKLEIELSSELKMIFKNNVPVGIYEIAKLLFEIKKYFEENELLFLERTKVHESWLTEKQRQFEEAFRLSKQLTPLSQV